MRWRALFVGLLLAVVAQRLVELSISHRNVRWVRSHGGLEHGAGHYPTMVSMHALFFVCTLSEVWVRHPTPPHWLVVASLLVLLAAGALRVWVLRTLGPRWTTRVFVIPDLPRVTGGPYRYLRHPNYLAVAMELASLPLIGGAWITAVVFTAANGLILRHRVRVEEKAWEICQQSARESASLESRR
jgi:methyltransferase